MTEEAKKLIESVTKKYDSIIRVDFKDYVLKSEFDRVVEGLTKEIDAKIRQKIEYERLYNEANDKLISNGTIRSAIFKDISRNA